MQKTQTLKSKKVKVFFPALFLIVSILSQKVNLFPTQESLEPFLEQVVPLLNGLVDDNSTLTRQHTLRAICCLATLAKQRGCFTADILHKLYYGMATLRVLVWNNV